jgi:hypothetical protein
MAFQISQNIGQILNTSETQFIDVSPKPAQAKVVREGFQVPSVALDVQKASFLVDQLVTVTPADLPRVIAQSVAKGTKVAAGTVVDLVLAPKSSVPFDIFAATHADLKGKALSVADPVVNNADVRQILLTYDNPADVPTADQQTLTTAFAGVGITVNNSDPTRTFSEAFNAMRGAVAFR